MVTPHSTTPWGLFWCHGAWENAEERPFVIQAPSRRQFSLGASHGIIDMTPHSESESISVPGIWGVAEYGEGQIWGREGRADMNGRGAETRVSSRLNRACGMPVRLFEESLECASCCCTCVVVPWSLADDGSGHQPLPSPLRKKFTTAKRRYGSTNRHVKRQVGWAG
ncbi:uncharacterized protein BKA78DRAFT_306261 [Phyllosticta capitalensis]|uniref:uncharacterized protein n=1 Tax=Phyllosticta capitalensis TaxID=121624 RepID=UPI003131D428